MSVWKPENSEKMDCRKDDRNEAFMHDNHANGVHKQEKDSTLVSYVPIKCST